MMMGNSPIAEALYKHRVGQARAKKARPGSSMTVMKPKTGFLGDVRRFITTGLEMTPFGMLGGGGTKAVTVATYRALGRRAGRQAAVTLKKTPTVVKVGAAATAAGATIEGASQLVERLSGTKYDLRDPVAQALRRAAGGVRDVARRQTGFGGKKMAGGLKVGGQLPPTHQVVRVWQTFPGGPVFARLSDGHIAVQKKDGTIKHYRPYRPVVIPRRWNARSMGRVATALKRQRKMAQKIMKLTGGK